MVGIVALEIAGRDHAAGENGVAEPGREALENAPTLDGGDSLEMDSEELREIYIYYGHSPYWEGP